MDGRSQTGCWTCRARRKRCDENRPTCSTCNSLGLPCHGYGPRPTWMDGGSLQRARALEFKEIVKQRPRRRWPSGSDKGTRDTINERSSSESIPPMDQTTGLSRKRRNVPMDLSTNISIPEANMIYQPISPACSNVGASVDIPNAFKADLDAMTPLDVFNLSQSCNQMVSLESINWPNSFLGGIYVEDINPIRPDTFATMMGSDSQSVKESALAKTGHEPGWLYIKPNETNAATGGHEGNVFFQPITTFYTPIGQLVTLKTWELDALWYYFERIFPQKFPFLDPSESRIIGNELWRLASTSRCCLAFVLGQSLTIHQIQLQKLGIEPQSCLVDSAESRGKVAVEELRLLVQHLDIILGNGGIPDVDSQTEIEVCLVLAMLSETARAQMPLPEICALQKHLALIPLESLSAKTSLLSSFFQSVLISLSVLSCISNSVEPDFARKFRDQLLDDKSQLCIHKSCSLDIAELQVWKESVARSGTTSVVELVKRAIPIESELRQIRILHVGEGLGSAEFDPLVRQELTITKLMACAAEVYLHGTLCDLRPEVPELKNAVADTIAAIKLIPGAAILRCLLWPITIAAVAADGSDKKFFEEVGRGVQEQFGRCQLFLGLNAAFEFWQRRNSSMVEKREYTWKEALSYESGAVLFV